MNVCEKLGLEFGRDEKRAPVLVPVLLVLMGAVLLPLDCVYNQVTALILIGIGGSSLLSRVAGTYCQVKAGAIENSN